MLAHEGAAGDATRDGTAAVRVYEKLHGRLSDLVGVAGADLLFARSAKLTQDSHARFAGPPGDEDATKLCERLQAQDPAIATESAAALFGNLFALTTTFIGEGLTTQLLRSTWPTLSDAALREQGK